MLDKNSSPHLALRAWDCSSKSFRMLCRLSKSSSTTWGAQNGPKNDFSMLFLPTSTRYTPALCLFETPPLCRWIMQRHMDHDRRRGADNQTYATRVWVKTPTVPNEHTKKPENITVGRESFQTGTCSVEKQISTPLKL